MPPPRGEQATHDYYKQTSRKGQVTKAGNRAHQLFLSRLQGFMHYHSTFIHEQAEIVRTNAKKAFKTLYEAEDAGEVIDKRVIVEIATEARNEVATQITRKIFPFFRLPAEIRNLIYSECLISSHPLTDDLYRRAAYPIDVLLISRQAYIEARPILYSGNCFRFQISNPKLPSVKWGHRWGHQGNEEFMRQIGIQLIDAYWHDNTQRMSLGGLSVEILELIHVHCANIEILETHGSIDSLASYFPRREFEAKRLAFAERVRVISSAKEVVLVGPEWCPKYHEKTRCGLGTIHKLGWCCVRET